MSMKLQALSTTQLNQALFEGKEFQILYEVTRDAPNYHDDGEYSKFGRGVPQVHDYYEWRNTTRAVVFAAVEKARAASTNVEHPLMVPTEDHFRILPEILNRDDVIEELVNVSKNVFTLNRSTGLSHADSSRIATDIMAKATQELATWMQRQPNGQILGQ